MRSSAASSSFQQPTCVVCLSDCRQPDAVDCDSFQLPLSRSSVREKIRRWKRERRTSDWEDPGVLGRLDQAVYACGSCLSLVMDIERLETNIDKRFRTLWSLMGVDEERRGRERSGEELEERIVEPETVLEEVPVKKRRGRPPVKPVKVEDREEPPPSLPKKRGRKPKARPDEEENFEVPAKKPKKVESDEDYGAYTTGGEEDNGASLDGMEEKEAYFSDDDHDYEQGEDEEDDDDGDDEYLDQNFIPFKGRQSKGINGSQDGDSRDSFKGGSEGGLSRNSDEPPTKKPRKPRRRHTPKEEKPKQPPKKYEANYYLTKLDEVFGARDWFRSECRVCDLSCDTFPEVVSHTKQTHPGNKAFACHFCLSTFDCPRTFFSHVLREELAREFKCHVCQEDMKNPRRLEKHIRESHEGQPAFSCCNGLPFDSWLAFINHRRKPLEDHDSKDLPQVIWDNNYTCHGCGKDFRVFQKLEKHLIHVEFNDLRKCDDCGLTFRQTDQAYNHKANIHGIIQGVFQCDICKRDFPTIAKMRIHRWRHDNPNRTFTGENREKICPVCGKAVRGDYMYLHIAASHNNEQKFACKFCPMRFNHRRTMKRHMARNHDYRTDYFRFPCSVCDKVCAELKSLKKHEFVSHGIRDESLVYNTCPTCGKEFVGKDVFEQHMMMHSGAKPHACPHCDHRVVQFTNLVHHMRKAHNRKVRRVFLSRGNKMDYVIVDENVSNEDAKRMAMDRNL